MKTTEDQKEVPKVFTREVTEYIDNYVGSEEKQKEDQKALGQEFTQNEKEDKVPKNQLMELKEMASAPFGPKFNVTKEQYAQQMAKLEEQKMLK